MAATTVILMAGILALGASARAGAETDERMVPVCMPLGWDVQSLRAGQKLASKMFAEIGVNLEWRQGGICAKDDVVITLSYKTPDDQFPGAWAYALPFEGTHIVIFWDRIQLKMPGARAPILLAHVLVHEITHVLQGTVRHSESGVMKPVWTSSDFFAMGRSPLPFTPLDVLLILHGLDALGADSGWDAHVSDK